MTAALELLGGLVGLVLSGTAIVRSASVIGAKFGLPPLVIGLTIVAAGTSAPELAVVWQAADDGDSGLALGSVVGSNIANILLVLGIVAVIQAINVTRQAVVLDAPVMVASSVLVLLLGLDGELDRTDGLILLACLVTYVTTTILVARRNAPPAADDARAAVTAAGRPAIVLRLEQIVDTLPGAVTMFVLAAIGVAISAQFVVSGAGSLAVSWGMSELVVGLTVLAVGTSAPEIATSVIAALRGHSDVALGNAIGSNIFNLLFVLGLVSAAQSDLPVDDALQQLNLPIMLAAAALALPYAITQLQIERVEGAMFLLIYAVYTTYVVLDGTGNDASDEFGLIALAVVTPLSLLVIVTAGVRHRRRDRTGGRVSE